MSMRLVEAATGSISLSSPVALPLVRSSPLILYTRGRTTCDNKVEVVPKARSSQMHRRNGSAAMSGNVGGGATTGMLATWTCQIPNSSGSAQPARRIEP